MLVLQFLLASLTVVATGLTAARLVTAMADRHSARARRISELTAMLDTAVPMRESLELAGRTEAMSEVDRAQQALEADREVLLAAQAAAPDLALARRAWIGPNTFLLVCIASIGGAAWLSLRFPSDPRDPGLSRLAFDIWGGLTFMLIAIMMLAIAHQRTRRAFNYLRRACTYARPARFDDPRHRRFVSVKSTAALVQIQHTFFSAWAGLFGALGVFLLVHGARNEPPQRTSMLAVIVLVLYVTIPLVLLGYFGTWTRTADLRRLKKEPWFMRWPKPFNERRELG